MCCTFGDKTDIEWYKKHNLAYIQSIGFDGKMKLEKDPAGINGLPVAQARTKIVEELESPRIDH